jgi:hypothetical protein
MQRLQEGGIMSKKHIRIISSSYCAIDPQHEETWLDVWLRFDIRRKQVRLAPCICSKTDIEDLKDEPSDIWEYEHRMLKRLECEPIVIDNPSDPITNIFVDCDFLTKKKVESVLTHYLRELGYLKSEPTYRWQKPKIFTIGL